MRRLIPTVAAILALAAPAAAQLNTYYEGFERYGGKRFPATAQYSVDAGRAVAVMKGEHAFRLIYLQKEGVLRMLLDSDKQYMDVPATEGGLAGSLAAQLESQMAELPPEERKMVQDMMKKTQSEKPTAALEYVWTDESRRFWATRAPGWTSSMAAGRRASTGARPRRTSRSPRRSASASWA